MYKKNLGYYLGFFVSMVVFSVIAVTSINYVLAAGVVPPPTTSSTTTSTPPPETETTTTTSPPTETSTSTSTTTSTTQDTNSSSNDSSSDTNDSNSTTKISTTSASSNSQSDQSKSSIQADKEIAVADGTDKITLTVILVDKDGKTIIDITPTIEISGEGNNYEIKKEGNNYIITITSTIPGEKTIKVKSGDIELPEVKGFFVEKDTSIAQTQNISTKSIYYAWWFWLLIILLIVLIVYLIYYELKLKKKQPYNQSDIQNN